MKKHYIYKTYISKDNKVHTEKFPIIYENKHNIYFQDGRLYKEMLNRVDREHTYNTFSDFLKSVIENGGYYSWMDMKSKNPLTPMFVYTIKNPNLTNEEKEKLVFIDNVYSQKSKINNL